MTKMKTLVAAAAVAAATVTLAACGSNDTKDTPGAGSSASSTGAHNKADVAFAQQMIPHHAQAVTMAKMADMQASSAEVKKLAADIEAAQGPEIEQMSAWLKAWGEDVPSTDASTGDMSGMDMGSDAEMPGMMTSAQMDKLGSAQGEAFDKMFLEMMIEHHQGAIEMSKTEQADGEFGDAVALAKKIESAQTAEIASMNTMMGS